MTENDNSSRNSTADYNRESAVFAQRMKSMEDGDTLPTCESE